MKRQVTNVVLVAAAIASILSTSIPVSACGGSGGFGGFGGGGFGGYSRPSIGFSRPFSQPARYNNSYNHYAQPTYTQPTYSQSIYSQPQTTFAQPAQTSFARPTQTSLAQPTQTTAARPTQARTQVASPRVAPATTPVQTRPPASQAAPAQATSTQPVAAKTTDAQTSALQMLASIASANTKPAVTSTTDAVIPEFTAAVATSTSAHVGTWRVNLPGNQSVELVLNDDSSFVWTATKNGKTSKFDGQYRMNDGRLTLVRSADLQQMAGSWNGQDTAFTFKLDGAKNGGLKFQRS